MAPCPAVASGASFEALKAALATEQANGHMLEKERDSLSRQIEALSGEPIDPAKASLRGRDVYTVPSRSR